MCYIETSNLDGETNLKIRQVIISLSYIFVYSISWEIGNLEVLNWKSARDNF